MASLAEYYQGIVGAGALDWRDREQLVQQGEALRYSQEDMPFVDDRTLRENRERGAIQMLPRAEGGFSTIRPDANVLPGGDRLISGQEAAARYARSQAGGRPLDDPYGLARGAYQGQQNAAEMQAYKTADYLAQFLPPERVAAETQRLTGVDLSGRLSSTPNLLKRAGEEAGIRKTGADITSAQVTAEENRMDIAKKKSDLTRAVSDDYKALETNIGALNTLEDLATKLMNNERGLMRATGKMSYLKSVRGSDAYNFEAGIGSLKAQVSSRALQAMREASKTGGALGNVSDKDISLLENSIAALDIAQDPAAMSAALADVVKYTQNLRQSAGSAFASTHGVPEKVLPKAAVQKITELGEGGTARLQNGQVWMVRNGVPTRVR